MIIIAKHTNQLCNRLFTYLPILSYALEAHQPVLFLFQYRPYANLFPNLRKAGYHSLLTSSHLRSLRATALYALIRLLDHALHVVLHPAEPIPLHAPLGFLFAPRWREIRYDKAYIPKHANTLRHLFAPSEEVTNTIAQHIQKGRGLLTIGVHIRRGDYAQYRPELLFPPETYANYMRQTQQLLASQHQPIQFLLCSNEPVNTHLFPNLTTITIPNATPIIDLYALAACDYIIGVPSTFSLWASFYGQVPLLHFDSPNTTISLHDFHICHTLTP